MSIKSPLHARNRHIDGYDYKLLSAVHPELCAFIINNQYNHQPTINFSDPDAVKALNCALLKHHYHIEHWDIPQGFLCPPIPGRVDYIHYLADLLKQSLAFVPSNHLDKVNVLDIGTGASCIYPILGKKEYNWSFVASDIDPISIQMAKNIIHLNHELKSSIECRLQIDSNKIFINVIKKNEFYHLSVCNPPFHKSLADAQKGTTRKQKNLTKKPLVENKPLNFGGQKAELWCPGGEVAFISKMINESKIYRQQVLWFTSLVSKNDNLSAIKLSLKKANVSAVKVINMAQGSKISRFIAWSFIVKI